MKRDKELMREILLQVEASTTTTGWIELELPGHSEVEVSNHVELLSEAGFLQAHDLSTLDGPDWRPERLTYEGHEFLDTVRDPEIWRNTREAAKKIGSSSVEVLFEIGKNSVKQKLAQHEVHLP